MSTETQTTKTTKSKGPSVFAPLGKYAVIAVIMVSIIVTTAIMLDKQLNTTERNLATIENEIAAMSASQSENASTTENNTSITTTTAIISTTETDDTANIVAAAEVENTSNITTATDVQDANKENHSATQAITAVAAPVAVNTIQPATKSQAQFAMNNHEQAFENRIATYKKEQKQRMADMFARIRTLEAQQLDKYKASQEKQIARLRNQVSHQQAMIETLVLRNQDLYEFRAANVQRIQTNREKVLNRI